jgi:hypothetical protein
MWSQDPYRGCADDCSYEGDRSQSSDTPGGTAARLNANGDGPNIQRFFYFNPGICDIVEPMAPVFLQATAQERCNVTPVGWQVGPMWFAF